MEETADCLAKEVAQLSAMLADRAAWSASVTADYTCVSKRAASEALTAVRRAEIETAEFLTAAKKLREECSSLYNLRDYVKHLLSSVALLEVEARKVFG